MNLVIKFYLVLLILVSCQNNRSVLLSANHGKYLLKSKNCEVFLIPYKGRAVVKNEKGSLSFSSSLLNRSVKYQNITHDNVNFFAFAKNDLFSLHKVISLKDNQLEWFFNLKNIKKLASYNFEQSIDIEAKRLEMKKSKNQIFFINFEGDNILSIIKNNLNFSLQKKNPNSWRLILRKNFFLKPQEKSKIRIVYKLF